MVKLLEKPDFTEYLETGNISEKYKIDTKDLSFKSSDKDLKFEYVILEILRNKEKQILYIYVSLENVPASDVLEINKSVKIESELVEKLKGAKLVSVIFDIDEEMIDRYISPNENKLSKGENIFDIKDSNDESILLNLKNYRVCDILF